MNNSILKLFLELPTEHFNQTCANVSSVSGLEIEDTESALAFLKQLSPDENSLDSMPIVTAKEPPKSGENLPKIDEGTDSAKKTLSERVS